MGVIPLRQFIVLSGFLSILVLVLDGPVGVLGLVPELEVPWAATTTLALPKVNDHHALAIGDLGQTSVALGKIEHKLV